MTTQYQSTVATPLPPTTQPPTLQPVPLPPPSTFDVLPALHQLLTRLLHDDQLQHPYAYSQPEPRLEIKDLGPAAGVLKSRLKRMREAISALPDVDREVWEQQEELQEVEERIKALRGVLEGLRQSGKVREDGDADTSMHDAGQGVQDGRKDDS